ncbi:MAG: response regulator [Lachnospiraceae bacterium]|nr:response regulator [Lachnospiraceae bacterium]
MKGNKNEKFIILLVSLACIGLTVESIVMSWEFWVPPLILIGTVSLWVMNLSGKPSYELRIVYYLIYAMLALFFHGVHDTSFFDVALVVTLVMIAYSFFDRIIMIHLFFIEYIIIMVIQFRLVLTGDVMEFDTLTISRVILHFMIVLLVYNVSIRSIRNREEEEIVEKEKDEMLESVDADMEDFLSNISHELRTPVNVVNGMSEILMKKNIGPEILSVKDAGVMLAYQIEDIQDYTECKRNKIILEEEEYMSISLINDVVMGFRLGSNDKKLELVVDIDPAVPAVLKGDVKKLHKIFRHLLINAIKFTKQGGVYIRLYSEKTDYGINLCIEMMDTGIGMDLRSIQSVVDGMYQVNKKRNRSSGGVGLGLFIVYGFAHRMGGFVKIESEKGNGTTVRVTIPQKVVNPDPSLVLSTKFSGNILFHVKSDKYKVPRVRDFYRAMATHLAVGIKVPLFSAESVKEISSIREKMDVTAVFMGEEEYAANSDYMDALSREIIVAVSANSGFKPNEGSNVIVMPKPLYAYPVIKILNEGRDAKNLELSENAVKPVFDGVRALVVDDEPMNLIVARGMFSDYKMMIDTAASGREAIDKFYSADYDIIFMDHMMPEMDGVEAMKRIRKASEELKKPVSIVALTANAVSGAKEMFMKEGFDGFIAKPIYIPDFERVMLRVLPQNNEGKRGAR